MIRHIAAACLALFLFPQDGLAQERDRIGYGRLVTNDYLADGKDRWRSGSIASSRVWGRGWAGALPTQPGEVLELRLGAEIIAPENLKRRAAGDRPYAGLLSAGLHTHFMRGGAEIALGADLVFIGPQTRLDDLQNAFHDLVNVHQASAQTRLEQIGNAVHPTLVAEAGRDIFVQGNMSLRPFVEARAGIETLVRAGVDVTIGQPGPVELLVRDPVSGHRYRTMPAQGSGPRFVLGADLAAVQDSALLPSSYGLQARDTRGRLRGGVHFQGGPAMIFYGLTYLGKEFTGQREAQVIGSVRIDINF